MYTLFLVGRGLLENLIHSTLKHSSLLKFTQALHIYLSCKIWCWQRDFCKLVEHRCHSEENGVNNTYWCTKCNDLQIRSSYLHGTRFNFHALFSELREVSSISLKHHSSKFTCRLSLPIYPIHSFRGQIVKGIYCSRHKTPFQVRWTLPWYPFLFIQPFKNVEEHLWCFSDIDMQ